MNNIRYDLLPIEGIKEVCKVFTEKLNNHQENEWRKGLKWSEVLNSLKKHLTEFELGNDYTETGELRIASVAAQALILAEFTKIYSQGDNRQLSTIARPRVSLDVDDVVISFVPEFEKKFNIKLTPYWKGTYQMNDLLNQVKDDKEFWINLPVLHHPGFEPTCYITSRSIPTEWTMECLERNNCPCAPVYSVPFNESKIELLKKNNIDIHIDDKVDNYKDCIDNGIFCYLMDAPHNRYLQVGHRRIYNLDLNI